MLSTAVLRLTGFNPNKEITNGFEYLLPQSSPFQMTHVPCVIKFDPLHLGDKLEERGGGYIVRCIILAVIDKSCGRDLWEPRDGCPVAS